MNLAHLFCLLFSIILVSCQVKGGGSNGLVQNHNPVNDFVSIDTPPAVNIANVSTYSVSGDCSRNGENVDLTIGTLNFTFVCIGSRYNSGPMNLSTLPDSSPLALSVDHASVSSSRQTLKDTVAPTLLSTSISPGTRVAGQNIDVTVGFSEPVQISGTPRIGVTLNTLVTSPSYAVALSGPSASNRIFRYTVANGDEDSDGVDLTASIDLNGGTLRDIAGNPAPLALAQTNFPGALVAGAAPIVSLITPANNSFINIVSDSATFAVSGTCDEAAATVVIKIDGVVATSPSGLVCDGANFIGSIDTTGLAEGARSFVAELTNPGGTGTSSAHSVTKDITAPTLTLNAPANVNTSNVASYSLSGTCSENGQSVSVNFGALSNSATCTTGAWSVTGWNVSAEADNASINVTADHTDLAGNPATQQTASVSKDTTGPTIALVTPANGSYINIASDSATFAVSGTCSESGATVSIEIDTTPAASPVGFLCDGVNFSGTIDTTGLSQGARSFTASITDTGLNTTTTSANTVTKDVTAPTLTLTSPANVNSANAASYSLSGTCSENGQTISVNFGALSNSASCGSGSWSISGWNVSGQPDNASISVTADHADLAGNPATQQTASVSKDTVAPTVSITFSPNITAGNVGSYSIAGNCSENGLNLSVSIGALNYTPACSTGSWSVGPVDVSSVPDSASVAISAAQTDTAGNIGTANTTVDKNTSTPTVAITTAPDISAANKTNYTISGTCSENGITVSLMIGSISRSANCSSFTWNSGVVDVSALPEGAVFITADHSTAPQASTTVNKDTLSPTVTISSAPDINLSNETSYQVTGTCSQNGVTVSVFVDSLNFTPTCSSGTWSTGFQNVSSIPDGTGIIVTADHSTATQAQTAINKATSTPSVGSLSVPLTFPTIINLSWNLVDPGGYTINDYVIQYRIKGNPTWLTFNDGVSTTTSTSVTGLTESTLYEFRVAVIYDTSFQSAWSNVAEGQTQPNSPLFGPNVAMNVGGATDTTVVAHDDGTNVTLNGSPLITLNKGQTHRFTSVQFDVIDADKPIFTAGRRGSGSAVNTANIVWQPTAWAGKKFSFNANRESLQMVDVYAVENTTVEARLGGTLLASANLTAGQTTTLSWATLGSYQMQSTGTILAFHISGDGGSRLIDPKPLLPDSLEIIGFPSNSMQLTTGTDGTNYSAIHSNSVTASGSLNKNNVVTINPQGSPTSLYQSESLLISADQKIFGASYADSNGNCAAPFLPTNLMKHHYAIPVNGDYIAFASKTAGTIEVRNAADTLITTLTLTRSGASSSAPYKARMANPLQGYRYIATTPVAAWYQANSDTGGATQDETVMYGRDP